MLQSGLPDALLREINVMKQLVHKNLIQLVEIINDQDSKYLYLVLEHIEGGPIMSYHPSRGKFVYSITGTVMGEATAK